MLDRLFVSIANKPNTEELNVLLRRLHDIPSLDIGDKSTIKYALTVAEHGNYPGVDYFNERGYNSAKPTKSLSEIKNLALEAIDFYTKESLIQSTLTSINESESSADLASRLSELSKIIRPAEMSLKNFSAEIPDDSMILLKEGQFLTGMSEIDSVTKGVQPGTMAVIAAFTGHGKSTEAVSACFKNIKAGKKGIFVSIEMATRLVKLQFFIRYLFDTQQIVIPFLALASNTIDDKEKIIVAEARPKFNAWIKDKLLILDETVLDKTILSDYHALNSLYAAAEMELGGFDFSIWDHANQIDLIFKDMGNVAIRTITSAGKTYQNQHGSNPATIILAQTNRDGYKRAVKKQGKYDLTALSDLNELERSAAYAIFLFTNDAMKLTQETKVVMVKHRLGPEVPEPITVNFNAPVYLVGEEVEQITFGGNVGGDLQAFSFGGSSDLGKATDFGDLEL